MSQAKLFSAAALLDWPNTDEEHCDVFKALPTDSKSNPSSGFKQQTWEGGGGGLAVARMQQHISGSCSQMGEALQKPLTVSWGLDRIAEVIIQGIMTGIQ